MATDPEPAGTEDEGKELPAGETPVEITERIVEEHQDAVAAETGIAGSYYVEITLHSPSRLEEPDGPTAVALDEALTEFLGQKYGFRVGVRVRRSDR